MWNPEAVARSCSVKLLLKIQQNLPKNPCAWVSFLKMLQAEACNFIKNDTLAKVFYWEFNWERLENLESITIPMALKKA